jgi:hypothetical protein
MQSREGKIDPLANCITPRTFRRTSVASNVETADNRRYIPFHPLNLIIRYRYDCEDTLLLESRQKTLQYPNDRDSLYGGTIQDDVDHAHSFLMYPNVVEKMTDRLRAYMPAISN